MINKLKKVKPIILAALALLFILMMIYFNTPKKQNAYINYDVQRVCNFVTVGEITGAFCNDGTEWLIKPMPPLVNP